MPPYSYVVDAALADGPGRHLMESERVRLFGSHRTPGALQRSVGQVIDSAIDAGPSLDRLNEVVPPLMAGHLGVLDKIAAGAVAVGLFKFRPDAPRSTRPIVNGRPAHGRSLILLTESGAPIDFSWKTAASSRLESADHRQRRALQHAARRAVADQTAAFRRSAPATCSNPYCSLLDPPLQVDHHKPTFIELLEAFIAANGEHTVIGALTWPPVGPPLLTEPTSSRWAEFHAERAVLRMLCKSCNLGWARRGATGLLTVR
jgi:hypothetical protein